MPEIKNYSAKKKPSSKAKVEVTLKESASKRRSHLEEQVRIEQEEIIVAASDVIEDVISAEAQNEGVRQTSDTRVQDEASSDSTAEAPSEKTHLEFFGSEFVRQKAPKVMEFADVVADQWVQDGEFEALPVEHPLARLVARKTLRKAKDIEKKLEEKGVFMMANMGLEYLKSEIKKRRG